MSVESLLLVVWQRGSAAPAVEAGPDGLELIAIGSPRSGDGVFAPTT